MSSRQFWGNNNWFLNLCPWSCPRGPRKQGHKSHDTSFLEKHTAAMEVSRCWLVGSTGTSDGPTTGWRADDARSIQKCPDTCVRWGGGQRTGASKFSWGLPHGWLHRKCTVKTITNMRFEKASMRIRGWRKEFAQGCCSALSSGWQNPRFITVMSTQVTRHFLHRFLRTTRVLLSLV